MLYRPPLPVESRRLPAELAQPTGYRGHAHFWERALSRRQLLRTAAGVSALAATGMPVAAAARGRVRSASPRPIPFDLFGGQGPAVAHVDLPYFGNELATMTDFRGFVAAAEIQGFGVGTDTATGATTTYTYDADMRIMDGTYIAEDGRPHHSLFGFVWLDLFEGQFDLQVHDFEPGIASNGLFWTIPIPNQAAEIHLGQGAARFHMTDLAIPDWHDFFNSIGASDPPIPPVPATVTFDTRWQAVGPLTRISDPTKGFQGEFRDSQATIQWSAEEPALAFRFVTDASAPTHTIGAAIGREQNGVFFR